MIIWTKKYKQVRNEVENYTGGANSTVEKSFGSLSGCRIAK